MSTRARRLSVIAIWAVTAGCSAPSAAVDASAYDAETTRDGGVVPRTDAAIAFPTLVGMWGGYGTEPGQFVEPSSIELDSLGFVYVAGHENRVQKFTADGELLTIWGTAGTGDGQFNHPHGLAIDRARGDLVYVGDQENHRVQVFTHEGVFVRLWNDAQFEHIHDVGIDPSSGDIYVGDYELHVLQRFSSTGDPLAELGGPGREPGRFNGVWGISTDSRGNVYVADSFNRRVQIFDRDGVVTGEWTGVAGAPFTKPTGVFVDRRDVVYVCDSLAQSVLLFDTEGTLLEQWSLPEILGMPSEPEDIVVDAAGSHIYIAEVLNHRVFHLLRQPRL